MRNLNRLTNYANKLEAWRDWTKLANAANHYYGGNNLVEAIKPRCDASWREVDRCIARLRKELHINPDCPDCDGYGVMHLGNGQDKACDCTWRTEEA